MFREKFLREVIIVLKGIVFVLERVVLVKD